MKTIGTIECSDEMIMEALTAFVGDMIVPGMNITTGSIYFEDDAWKIELVDQSLKEEQ